jgi:hypothetical protein
MEGGLTSKRPKGRARRVGALLLLVAACGTDATSNAVTADVRDEGSGGDTAADIADSGVIDGDDAHDEGSGTVDWDAEAARLRQDVVDLVDREGNADLDRPMSWPALLILDYFQVECGCQYADRASECFVRSVNEYGLTLEAILCVQSQSRRIPAGEPDDALHSTYISWYSDCGEHEGLCGYEALHACALSNTRDCANGCAPLDLTVDPLLVLVECGMHPTFPPAVVAPQ